VSEPDLTALNANHKVPAPSGAGSIAAREAGALNLRFSYSGTAPATVIESSFITTVNP
jgi:hypothetical protein